MVDSKIIFQGPKVGKKKRKLDRDQGLHQQIQFFSKLRDRI